MQVKESKTKWHFYVSIVKSGFRFGACFSLWYNNLAGAAVLFAVAEILGILEEV